MIQRVLQVSSTPNELSMGLTYSIEGLNASRDGQTQYAVPPLSHQDPVPADCCSVCRRRGGNYAYTCVYEDDSGKCKRCVKEKHKCRPATTEEIARSEARCPQCKSRGLTKCWFEPGKSSCEPCLKWKKICGAPTKRVLNANTRSFLGLPSPEPDQERPAEDGQSALAESSGSTSIDTAPRPTYSPIPQAAVLPSRTRRSTRQSTAATSFPLESENEQTPAVSEQPAALSGSQEFSSDSSRRRSGAITRLSLTLSTRLGRHVNGTKAEQGATLHNSTLVRQLRRASGRQRSSALPLTMQEATPDDSAAEDIQSSFTNVEIADDESADLQLITESTTAATSFAVGSNSAPYDSDAPQASLSDSDSSDHALRAPRRHSPGADGQTSRLRRGRARPSYIEVAPSDASDQDLSEDDDEMWDPVSDVESIIDDEDEFEDAAQSSMDENAEDEDDDEVVYVDIEPEPISVPRRKSQLPPK